MAQNPVIRKFGESGGERQPAPSPEQLQHMYDQPPYVGPTSGAPARYMTLDDVIVRSAAMLVVVLVAGAASWSLVGTSASVPLLLIGFGGALAIGFYAFFTMRVNAVVALSYSAFQGVLLGAISRAFEDRYPGIAVQAVIGTVAVAAGMLVVYRVGAIRVTPRFTRIVVGATIGVFALMLVNLVSYLFSDGGLGLRHSGFWGIAFSLLCIVVAAMNLVVDFDVIERGIRQGADEKYAWYAAFGLMVTLLWLYLEIMRLLSYLRGR